MISSAGPRRTVSIVDAVRTEVAPTSTTRLGMELIECVARAHLKPDTHCLAKPCTLDHTRDCTTLTG